MSTAIAADYGSGEALVIEATKQRRLQIHLSTAVVVMVVTGFLVFLNIRSFNMSEPQRDDFDSDDRSVHLFDRTSIG